MGSDTKKIRKEFVLKSLWNREGIEAFLEKRASEGWVLDAINEFRWVFRKEEPKKLHFSVIYFPKASSYDPAPSDRLLLFQDLCEHTGWKLAAGEGQTQIYYNEADDAIPIETEEEMALLAIHESAKRYYLPVCYFLAILGLIQFGLFCYRLATNTMFIVSNNAGILSGIGAFFVLALPVFSIGQYYRWHRRVEEMIDSGEGAWKGNGPMDLRAWIIGMMFAAMAFMIISLVGGRSGIEIIAMSMVGILGITVVVLEFSKLMKKRMVSGKTNRTLTYVGSMVGALLVAVFLFWVMVQDVQEPGDNRSQPEVRVTNGLTEYIYHDTLPLTIEDLRTVEYQGYSYEIQSAADSVLCRKMNAAQTPGVDGLDEPKLSYRVAVVKFPLIYGICRSALEKDFAHDYGRAMGNNVNWEEHVPVDATEWGAKEAYQLRVAGELRKRYLLCYERRIVEIDFDSTWDVTPLQKSIVAEKIGK